MTTTTNITKNTTLANWLHYWFSQYKMPIIKNSTYDDYSAMIDKHIIPKLGDIKLKDLSPDKLQTFFNEKKESGNLVDGSGLSNKSVKSIYNLLRAALTKATDLDVIPKNPMRTVEILPLEKVDMIVLTAEEEAMLTNYLINTHFEGKYDFAIFLAMKCGLRNGETSALKYGCFDFNEYVIHIRSRVKRIKSRDENSRFKTYMEIAPPKTKESNRDIPFNDRFAEITKAYFKSRFPQSNHKDYFLFQSNTGSVADPGTVNRYFQTKLREVGIKKKMRFHDLRHTFATRAIEKHVDIKSLSVILGHTSVQFTLDRYAHVLADQKRATMETMLSDL